MRPYPLCLFPILGGDNTSAVCECLHRPREKGGGYQGSDAWRRCVSPTFKSKLFGQEGFKYSVFDIHSLIVSALMVADGQAGWASHR
jgi:hypothetical protein